MTSFVGPTIVDEDAKRAYQNRALAESQAEARNAEINSAYAKTKLEDDIAANPQYEQALRSEAAPRIAGHDASLGAANAAVQRGVDQQDKAKELALIMTNDSLSVEQKRAARDQLNSAPQQVIGEAPGGRAAFDSEWESTARANARERQVSAGPVQGVGQLYSGHGTNKKREATLGNLKEGITELGESQEEITERARESTELYKEELKTTEDAMVTERAQYDAAVGFKNEERDNLIAQTTAATEAAQAKTQKMQFFSTNAGMDESSLERIWAQKNDPSLSERQKAALDKQLDGAKEIDPMRAFAGTAPKIFAILTLVGEGMKALGGGQDRSQEILNGFIDRDVQAQMEKRRSLKERVSQSRKDEASVRYDGQRVLAENTYGMGLLQEKLANQLGAFKDRLGTSQQRHNADLVQTKLENDSVTNKFNGEKLMTDVELKSFAATDAVGLRSNQNKVTMNNQREKARAAALAANPIFAKGFTRDPRFGKMGEKESSSARSRVDALTSVAPRLKKLMEMREENWSETIPSSVKAEMDSMFANLTADIGKKKFEGALQQHELDMIALMLGDSATGYGFNSAKMQATYDELVFSSFDYLANRGITPDEDYINGVTRDAPAARRKED